MSEIIIGVGNLGKCYQIDHERQLGYNSLRDVIASNVRNIFKKSPPTHSTENFWALRDINFEIKKGEAVGIIGRNGAGKSTLLKLLSRITEPTTGKIMLNGRVASLLEVGTGFHPELSGRENIFLNGAILGMSRREIRSKFDEIVDFSGVEKFLDTPVKRYSSGMYVRLAFAVAAHLEPDILVVDEVLAVGDAEFQKKCLGKMNDVSVQQGRTVLFVSHNMAAIKQLCNRSILLNQGGIEIDGTTSEVVNQYLTHNSSTASEKVEFMPNPSLDLSFTSISIINQKNIATTTFSNNDEIYIAIEFTVFKDVKYGEISICLKNSLEVNVLFANLSDSYKKKLFDFKAGKYSIKVKIKDNFLFPDTYYITLIAHQPMLKDIDRHNDVIRFDIIDIDSTMAPYGRSANAVTCVLGGTQWELTS